MRAWWELKRVKRENNGKEMREKKWEFGQIPSSLAILYTGKWLKLPFRDPLQGKSIISQKSCCNNLCQVAVLEELPWTANSDLF